jgi:predicted transcriptional regulator
MLSAGQVRAARALLDWSQQMLAEESGVSLATIRRVEGRGADRTTAPNQDAIKRALEKGGIVFTPKDSNGGVGVRLKK